MTKVENSHLGNGPGSDETVPRPRKRTAPYVLDDDRVIVRRREIAVVVAPRPPVQDLRMMMALRSRRGWVAKRHVLKTLQGFASGVSSTAGDARGATAAADGAVVEAPG